jgi:uncharacterized protein (TIGR03663 family)
MEVIQKPYEETKQISWLDRPLVSAITLNWETILFGTILALTFISRFYILGTRVQSHDETSHVYFSWRLYHGDGYQHDPVTHGPLQFHLLALSYFLLGDNDFSARVPAALFSIATIAFAWNFRRYLGRNGTLVAAFLLLISPFIMYYGRYARNEAFIGLFGLMTLWALLRYLETGLSRYLYWLTAAIVLHFTSKETAFIYTAQLLLFVGGLFVVRIVQSEWPDAHSRNRFWLMLLAAALLLGLAAGFTLLTKEVAPLNPAETAEPSTPGQGTSGASTALALTPGVLMAGFAALALIGAAYFLFTGYGWQRIRAERSFDVLILVGTLILPMLSPFLVKALGWNPIDYSSQGMLRTAVFLVPLALIAIAIGMLWNPRLWLINAALFYTVFTVFYTTLFTNGPGFFTGMVGSLGYWLEQQGVQRGNQPWYFYIAVQIPVYEYLPAIGSLLALVLILLRRNKAQSTMEPGREASLERDGQPEATNQPLATALLGFWVLTSTLAYTYAGEKMPWLTFHIAWPMCLLAGWSFGYLIDTTDWKGFAQGRGLIVLALLPVFFLSLAGLLGSLLGEQPPFQGKDMLQLQATSRFLISIVMCIASGWGLFTLMSSWRSAQAARIFGLTFLTLLSILTARTALTASFRNYDNANELLVYAHSGPGNKQVLSQIEEISRRTTNGLGLVVAYDNETTYPFWWYLRNYTNQRFFGDAPTRDLRDAPVILVGDKNYPKIETIVGQAYYKFDYIRMWWPNQDYYNLTWQRIWDAFKDPRWRSALFQIWLNRDYTKYGQLTNTSSNVSLPTWSPAAWMRLYLRKDVAAMLWNYGVGPTTAEVVADPYEGKEVRLSADILLGQNGGLPGQFKRPRKAAVAPDGTLYIADTENNRIQHFSRTGEVLHLWGSFADISKEPAPGGTFNQPWGLAISPDGAFVYVADVWNHRIQKFTADGQFITMWGYFGQGDSPEAFWGPRDVVIDDLGRVVVTDTGNDRLVIFDADGKAITSFGGQGFTPGEFDEPVGLAVDGEGRLFVADTWNQRMQVFAHDENGNYAPLVSWDIYGWFGESWDNKPYIGADQDGNIFVVDPESSRVLEFNYTGQILRIWGNYGSGPDEIGLAGAVAVDPTGGVWVTDTENGRLMHFILP